MHVLHVIPGLDAKMGGPAVALAGLAEAQARAGMHVSIIASFREDDDPALAQALGELGIGVARVGPVKGPLGRGPTLGEVVARNIGKADIVHIHGLWEEIQHLAARAAHTLKKPYFITPHGMLTPWSLARKKWKKRAYMAWRLGRHLDRAAAIHYISDRERAQCEPLGLRPPAIVEPIGVNLAEFEHLPQAGLFRAKFPALVDRPLIVFLGRIFPGKGLEYLVPAMAHVEPRRAMLAIVGPDSPMGYRATVENEIRRLKLEDRIVLAGAQNGADRIAALVDADVFCLPSDHENFGLAVVESLAAGTPAVISQEVAISGEITAAQVGATVAREPRAIGAELSRWLGDRSQRDGAAERCRPFVFERFDWRKIALRWGDRYGSLLRDPTAAG